MVHRINSGDPRGSRCWNKKIYCEHEFLQLGAVNTSYLGLVIDMDATPVMTLDQNQEWLDYCITFCDLQGYQAEGKAHKAALQYIKDRHDAPGRVRMRNILNQVLPPKPATPKPEAASAIVPA